ncbi:DUF7716 domain-containing protein [Zooshikella sp. RANM57]|uniref:DUF7716 domain-containing protein n=1 Tax=Zooshikella sp. RANM57 TaxID=3425863 RepID=UPI003D6F2DAA
MMINTLTTLKEVLLNASQLPWDFALYIPIKERSWLSDMPVMILDPEDTDDPDEAKKNGLQYALTVSSVQDVVENAMAQDKSASVELLIQALIYYYENDAFIALG